MPFALADLLIYKAQIRPILEYCSDLRGGASSTVLSLVDRIQRKAIRLINDSSLTWKLMWRTHSREVVSFAFFNRYYFDSCYSEVASTVPIPTTSYRSSRIQVTSYPYQVSIPRFRTFLFQYSFIPPDYKALEHSDSFCIFKTWNRFAFRTTVSRVILILLSSACISYLQYIVWVRALPTLM